MAPQGRLVMLKKPPTQDHGITEEWEQETSIGRVLVRDDIAPFVFNVYLLIGDKRVPLGSVMSEWGELARSGNGSAISLHGDFGVPHSFDKFTDGIEWLAGQCDPDKLKELRASLGEETQQ